MVIRLIFAVALFHVLFEHRDCEFRCVDWRRNFRDHVVKRADVVQMPVREQHRFDFFFALLDVADIRHDVVDPRIILARKFEAHVDHDHLVRVLEHRRVAADIRATDRNHAQLFALFRRERLGFVRGFRVILRALEAVIN